MPSKDRQVVAIIGAGPAGLMAAEYVARAGFAVHVYDAMPSAGRKFLLAGKSGMNLSHAEEFDQFKLRYRQKSERLESCLSRFDANKIRAWAANLGIETFVGTSGRIFPTDMKAAPLLRAWLQRLRADGVKFFMRHKWVDVENRNLCFDTPDGLVAQPFHAVVFALGGASWKRLGSDGKWAEIFANQKIATAPFQPSNCGFLVGWSSYFKKKFAGIPLTNVNVSLENIHEQIISRTGQFVITERGVEGSLIYAFSADIREKIQVSGFAELKLDLLPGRSQERVIEELSIPRGSRSLSSHLRSKLGLHPVHCALIHENLSASIIQDNFSLAKSIKALPLRLEHTFPIDEAISSAGGVDFTEFDDNFMLTSKPGWFCAGEMLDWEAPTGGYLLSACFATGAAAGQGVVNWLGQKELSVGD